MSYGQAQNIFASAVELLQQEPTTPEREALAMLVYGVMKATSAIEDDLKRIDALERTVNRFCLGT